MAARQAARVWPGGALDLAPTRFCCWASQRCLALDDVFGLTSADVAAEAAAELHHPGGPLAASVTNTGATPVTAALYTPAAVAAVNLKGAKH